MGKDEKDGWFYVFYLSIYFAVDQANNIGSLECMQGNCYILIISLDPDSRSNDLHLSIIICVSRSWLLRLLLLPGHNVTSPFEILQRY